MSEKIKIRHNICGKEYYITPNKFLSLKRRCPYCSKRRILTLDDVKKNVAAADEDYKVIDTVYKNNITPIKIVHKTCGRAFMMRYNDFIKGCRCPLCKESHGEKMIEKYLIEHKLLFSREYSFENLKTKRFDFAVFNEDKSLKMLIEYDGKFHWSKMNNSEYSQKKLDLQKKSDEKKENYCTLHKIKLIRIPYWYKDKLNQILDKIFKNNNFIVMTTKIKENSKINF